MYLMLCVVIGSHRFQSSVRGPHGVGDTSHDEVAMRTGMGVEADGMCNCVIVGV